MKITVNQLRRIIKEEISRVMSESDGKTQPVISIFLRKKVKQMVDKPDMEQHIADTWDAAVNKVPDMMDYIEKNSKPGYISSKARTEAILNAEPSINDSEATDYLNSALEMYKKNPNLKNPNLTGDNLKAMAAYARQQAAIPKKPVNPDATELAWNRDHPYSHWRST